MGICTSGPVSYPELYEQHKFLLVPCPLKIRVSKAVAESIWRSMDKLNFNSPRQQADDMKPKQEPEPKGNAGDIHPPTAAVPSLLTEGADSDSPLVPGSPANATSAAPSPASESPLPSPTSNSLPPLQSVETLKHVHEKKPKGGRHARHKSGHHSPRSRHSKSRSRSRSHSHSHSHSELEVFDANEVLVEPSHFQLLFFALADQLAEAAYQAQIRYWTRLSSGKSSSKSHRKTPKYDPEFCAKQIRHLHHMHSEIIRCVKTHFKAEYQLKLFLQAASLRSLSSPLHWQPFLQTAMAGVVIMPDGKVVWRAKQLTGEDHRELKRENDVKKIIATDQTAASPERSRSPSRSSSEKETEQEAAIGVQLNDIPVELDEKKADAGIHHGGESIRPSREPSVRCDSSSDFTGSSNPTTRSNSPSRSKTSSQLLHKPSQQQKDSGRQQSSRGHSRSQSQSQSLHAQSHVSASLNTSGLKTSAAASAAAASLAHGHHRSRSQNVSQAGIGSGSKTKGAKSLAVLLDYAIKVIELSLDEYRIQQYTNHFIHVESMNPTPQAGPNANPNGNSSSALNHITLYPIPPPSIPALPQSQLRTFLDRFHVPSSSELKRFQRHWKSLPNAINANTNAGIASLSMKTKSKSSSAIATAAAASAGTGSSPESQWISLAEFLYAFEMELSPSDYASQRGIIEGKFLSTVNYIRKGERGDDERRKRLSWKPIGTCVGIPNDLPLNPLDTQLYYRLITFIKGFPASFELDFVYSMGQMRVQRDRTRNLRPWIQLWDKQLQLAAKQGLLHQEKDKSVAATAMAIAESKESKENGGGHELVAARPLAQRKLSMTSATGLALKEKYFGASNRDTGTRRLDCDPRWLVNYGVLKSPQLQQVILKDRLQRGVILELMNSPKQYLSGQLTGQSTANPSANAPPAHPIAADEALLLNIAIPLKMAKVLLYCLVPCPNTLVKAVHEALENKQSQASASASHSSPSKGGLHPFELMEILNELPYREEEEDTKVTPASSSPSPRGGDEVHEFHAGPSHTPSASPTHAVAAAHVEAKQKERHEADSTMSWAAVYSKRLTRDNRKVRYYDRAYNLWKMEETEAFDLLTHQGVL